MFFTSDNPHCVNKQGNKKICPRRKLKQVFEKLE